MKLVSTDDCIDCAVPVEVFFEDLRAGRILSEEPFFSVEISRKVTELGRALRLLIS